MSALATAFLARYSATRVRSLTLPDNQDGSTYDSTKLEQAATDAADDFETLCGVTFDATVTKHLRAATMLMEAILLEWSVGPEASAKFRERANAFALSVAKVTGRDRIMPTTDSTLDVTADQPGERPAFDRSNTDPVTLNPPAGSTLYRGSE